MCDVKACCIFNIGWLLKMSSKLCAVPTSIALWGTARIPSKLAVGRLMGPGTIVYMTVKIKILAVLPETDNFYQKPLTLDYEESKIYPVGQKWALVKVQ